MEQFSDLQNRELTPVLQIIHISDFHMLSPLFQQEVPVRRIIQRILRKVNIWKTGFLPHDVTAPTEFLKFTKSFIDGDEEWSDIPTWVIDTGDLTTFGDDPSFELGKSFLNNFYSLSENIKIVSGIHGNHDTWPLHHPLCVNYVDLVDHREHLRKQWFKEYLPTAPFRAEIHGVDGYIELFRFNSALHDQLANARALGEVHHDRYWETEVAPEQLKQLSIMRQYIEDHSPCPRRTLRILAVHHPIHYPPPLKRHQQMYMRNAKAVANQLNEFRPRDCGPLAHIVLSGHTHQLYPLHGELGRTVRDCDHPPLGSDQCQLVVGSLMQSTGGIADKPLLEDYNQAQIIRIYKFENSIEFLVVERLLVVQDANGQFKICASNKSGQIGERITVAL